MYQVSIKHYGQADVDQFASDNCVAKWLRQSANETVANLGCHQWLEIYIAKRMVFRDIYGSLLVPGLRRNVLVIGGGVTDLTKRLSRGHDYCLIDLLSHDDPSVAQEIIAEHGVVFRQEDRSSINIAGDLDLVIANDIFRTSISGSICFSARFFRVPWNFECC